MISGEHFRVVALVFVLLDELLRHQRGAAAVDDSVFHLAAALFSGHAPDTPGIRKALQPTGAQT